MKLKQTLIVCFSLEGSIVLTGIVDYMKKQSGEAAKLLPTMAEVKRRENKEMAIVIGFFDNLEDPQLRAYMDVGMSYFYPAVTSNFGQSLVNYY